MATSPKFTPNPRIERGRKRADLLLGMALQPRPNPLPQNPYYIPGMAGMVGQLGSGLLSRRAEVQARNEEKIQEMLQQAAFTPNYTAPTPVSQAPRNMAQRLGDVLFPRGATPQQTAQAIQKRYGAPVGQISKAQQLKGAGISPFDFAAYQKDLLEPPEVNTINLTKGGETVTIDVGTPNGYAQFNRLLGEGWAETAPPPQELGENIKIQDVTLIKRALIDDAIGVAMQLDSVLQDPNYVGGLTGKLAGVVNSMVAQAEQLYTQINKVRKDHEKDTVTLNSEHWGEGNIDNIIKEHSITGEYAAALKKIATLNAMERSMYISLAYIIAKQNEPNGRLSDQDMANALAVLGGDGADPEIKRTVLNLQMNRLIAGYEGSLKGYGFKDPERFNLQKTWNPEQSALPPEAPNAEIISRLGIKEVDGIPGMFDLTSLLSTLGPIGTDEGGNPLFTEEQEINMKFFVLEWRKEHPTAQFRITFNGEPFDMFFEAGN